MKILLLHTEYQHKGGEDSVVLEERLLLETQHEVKTVTVKNKAGIKGALQFLASLWNIVAAREIKAQIQAFRPDVVHLHNWHFAMGPLVIRTARKEGVPIVVTLHNYRLLCPSAILMHEGKVFRKSLEAGFPWAAVRQRVYRNSMMQTFWLAFVNWAHRKLGTWKMVTRYIVLTPFSKDIFVNASIGIPASQFTIKANSVTRTEHRLARNAEGFLFVGRLSEEKGVEVLLEAFRHKRETLYVAGDGPLKEIVLDAARNSSNIIYLGRRDNGDIRKLMANMAMLILPSTCYEGMPVTILEAFSEGLPVMASNMGAMSSMIKHEVNGLLFTPGDPYSLYQQVLNWQQMGARTQQQMRQHATATYNNDYTPEKNLNQLFSIYQSITKQSETETFKYQHDRW